MEFVDRLLTCTDCGGEFIFTADGENMSAVSRACEQAAALVKGEAIHDVFVRTPEAAGRPVGRDTINLRSARGSSAGDGKANR